MFTRAHTHTYTHTHTHTLSVVAYCNVQYICILHIYTARDIVYSTFTHIYLDKSWSYIFFSVGFNGSDSGFTDDYLISEFFQISYTSLNISKPIDAMGEFSTY